MANKYGYMAKIGIDTSGVQSGLRDADRAMRSFDSELRQVNQIVRENGNSAEMAEQRNQLYANQVVQLTNRLNALLSVEQEINESRANGSISESEYREYRRDVERTQNALESLRETQRSIGENAGRDYSKVSDALKNIEKVALASTAAVGAALGKLSSDALSAYAKYEQLVGGIETLFTGAEDIVLENASKAFETAQISANNYMETVTGFSATLLQGLDGDTEKAAKIADQALIDMADNANKMGTAMGSVQYAYQGFAKQNYTMLDNLKLGYGGTQAEMARLINDSGVLNGQIEVTAETVKQVPFDKVIEAIHVIQTNLGITGTSAKEAATTIEGSMNMLKASWENALVDIARPLKDFAQEGLGVLNDNIDEIKLALTEMMEKFKPLLDDMIEKLKKWIDSGGIEKATDQFVETVTFIINNKDTLLGLFAALEIALGAERINNSIKGLKELSQAVNGLGNVLNAATGAASAMSISLSGWLGIAALAVAAAMALKNSIENARESLGQHSDTVNELDEAYEDINDKLAEFIELKERSLELAEEEAKKSLDNAKAEAQSYKSRIDILEKLLQKNREYYGTNNLEGKELFNFDHSGNAVSSAGYYSDISDELGSLYHDYYAANDLVKEFTNTIEESETAVQSASDNASRYAGAAAEAAENAAKNIGKTTSEVIDELVSEKVDKPLQAEVDKLDHKLKTHKITEEQYYSELKRVLDGTDSALRSESELWYSYFDKYNDFIDKKNKKDEEDRNKNSPEKLREEQVKNLHHDAEIKRINGGYSDDALENEEKYYDEIEKLMDKIVDKESSLYQQYEKEVANGRKNVREQRKKQDEKDIEDSRKSLEEWQKSSEKTIQSIQKKNEDVIKEFEKQKDSYVNAFDFSESVKTADGGERLVINDFSEQTKKLKKYQENVQKLKDTNISEEHFQRIMAMPFDKRYEYISEILKMSDKNRMKYYSDFEAYIAEAGNAARYDVQDELKDANRTAAEGIMDIFSSMPEDAYSMGKNTALSYLQGINDIFGNTNNVLAGITTDNASINYSNAAAAGAAVNAMGGTFSAANREIVINLDGKEMFRVSLDKYINDINFSGGIVGG